METMQAGSRASRSETAGSNGAGARGARLWTVLVAALVLLFTAACPVTVNDLEKWRNRPGSEELFVQWMLDPEATPDVRVKAIEMLVEQYNYEGAENLPQVAELPQQARDQAILGAVPRLRELLGGATFTLGGEEEFRLEPVQVRDSALLLADTTETPEVRAELMGIVRGWLDERYDPCVLSTGRRTTAAVLSTVGMEAGLPTVLRTIAEGDGDKVLCQQSVLREVTWLPEAAEPIAAGYIARWDARASGSLEAQLGLVEGMIQVPASSTLKDWMFAAHLTNPASQLMEESPEAVGAFVDYVRPLATPADADHYATMIRMREGNLRWIAFEQVMGLRGVDGLREALGAIPADGVWSRWAGQIMPDGLSRAATYLCGRPTRALGDAARPVYESFLTAENLVARAIAIRCLEEIGTAESATALEPLRASTSVIPAWGTENNTVGALATAAIEAIQAR
jgi:hypothetical protein